MDISLQKLVVLLLVKKYNVLLGSIVAEMRLVNIERNKQSIVVAS